MIDALLANFQNRFYNNIFPNINLARKIIKETIQLSQVKINVDKNNKVSKPSNEITDSISHHWRKEARANWL